MRIDVLTLFPAMFDGVFSSSILGKARDKGIVSLNTVNFRDYANNKHNTVDDYPYGGGGGMVLKPEPIFSAVEGITEGLTSDRKPRVILMCPQGQNFNQKLAESFAEEEHLIFICGHYEGYDERIREHLVTDELSIGDYVLTGGELPAMVVIDSVVRLLPGVLGNEMSAVTDSFSTGLLEYPHYTRPAKFRDWEVPDVLISGHHKNVDEWRRRQSLMRTWAKRPDLLENVELTPKERKWFDEWRASLESKEAPSADGKN
ncbi:TrmD [Paenibacillus mucilaginosus 3016]|uniref:tRNA (guanine-N(1)-)-methyltransferase n=1 Tax=Paenibacillus mucilaginosus 3016 TaxID=1116391 RepID=H6NQ82_9BACL|nr:tRNA (guanosine(37)-N1)-methyltransferase TrmD [Paenibacillus mucilaginosus]AFC31906.1 TrmD [Paenibacillus mucilaginosus 3016]WFA20419.1 tRNA (guanosine(37)-N1)-methyltransferase TrmD [Paenibacillus mucilaginosus]